MAIRDVKACNCVNVTRFNTLVNCRAQFFLFPQNLKFLNAFLVFLIIFIRFDLPRSGDTYIITKPVKMQTSGNWKESSLVTEPHGVGLAS